jgi:ABC-type nickel/cobalt efflux system permease component RcnA
MIIAVVIVVVAIAGWILYRRQRSKELRSRFGPEYESAVHQYGSAPKAEDALVARQKRMQKLHIHALPPDERDRFANQWHDVQSRFVDDPAGSIESADQLVCGVMSARGYPMSEFDVRAEDLSVDHPHVVRNYRAAHAIRLRRESGEASTEDLRQALVHYRELFDELLEAHVAVKGVIR